MVTIVQLGRGNMRSIFNKPGIIPILIAFLLAGCGDIPSATVLPYPSPSPTTGVILPTSENTQSSSRFDLSKHAFPKSVDSTKQYLFYLHGKIIEDQGIPAISPDYGEYEYQAILEALESNGFVVISERRAKNTESMIYAKRIAGQVNSLLASGVPANNISIVGASKGAAITILASHLIMNTSINYVLLSSCDPTTVKEILGNQLSLYGNVLSIYDSEDDQAGSCRELFLFSEGKGISRYNEIVLDIGLGHGILYKPLAEWLKPTIQWAGR
jgi:hypothetical protein